MFPQSYLRLLLLLLFLLVTPLLLGAKNARAQLILHEPEWSLLRTFEFDGPMAAHYNPIDGQIYVGRRGSSSDGLLPYRASVLNNFISENGIVAVLGDENQFVNCDIRRIRYPLSKERGHRFELSISTRS